MSKTIFRMQYCLRSRKKVIFNNGYNVIMEEFNICIFPSSCYKTFEPNLPKKEQRISRWQQCQMAINGLVGCLPAVSNVISLETASIVDRDEKIVARFEGGQCCDVIIIHLHILHVEYVFINRVKGARNPFSMMFFDYEIVELGLGNIQELFQFQQILSDLLYVLCNY